MGWRDMLSRWWMKLFPLRLARVDAPVTGMVAAIVSFELDAAPSTFRTEERQQAVLDRLSEAVRAGAGGVFDAAERNAMRMNWYFFARDVDALERALIAALRQEPDCRGALVRLTSNGVVGPWREIRV